MKILLLSIVLSVSNTVLNAAQITLYNNQYRSGCGGEYRAVMIGNLSNVSDKRIFQTFCVERSESLSFNKIYTAKVNVEVVGLNHPDAPLDPKTAWLYNEFRNGTLAGYFTNPDGRRASAGQLQKAIWFIEGEITDLGTNAMAKSFVAQATASDWNQRGTIGTVKVLNLYDIKHSKIYAQDVLCRIASVPTPAAVILVGIGTGILGVFRKKNFV
jgi:hypothetical protein